MIVRSLIAAVLLCGVLVQPVGAQKSIKGFVAPPGFGTDYHSYYSYKSGFKAYKSGDYAAALRIWTEDAERGVDESQFSLAWMYDKGLGIPQDYILGHMWSNLAAAQGNETAAKNREIAAEKMTPADISKAQRLAKACLKREYKRCD
jgi:TPR repeat protein